MTAQWSNSDDDDDHHITCGSRATDLKSTLARLNIAGVGREETRVARIYVTCQHEGCTLQACHVCTLCSGRYCDDHGDYWPQYRIYPYDDWRCCQCLIAPVHLYDEDLPFPTINVPVHDRHPSPYDLDPGLRVCGADDPDLSDQSPAPEYLLARIRAEKGYRNDAEVLELLDYRDEESAIVEYPSSSEDSSADEWDWDEDASESIIGDEESPWVTGEYVSFYAREAELEDDPDDPDYRDDVYFDDDFDGDMYEEMYLENDEPDDYEPDDYEPDESPISLEQMAHEEIILQHPPSA